MNDLYEINYLVVKIRLVVEEMRLSKRIWYPTDLPSRSFLSSETRSAIDVAANRRGCVQMIRHS